MRRLIGSIMLGMLLSVPVQAAQVVIGDWDFGGVPCFPGFDAMDDWYISCRGVGAIDPQCILEACQFTIICPEGGMVYIVMRNYSHTCPHYCWA